MPRNAKGHKKSIKKQVSDTHRYCPYCKAHRDGRGFDKHQAACKVIWQLERRRKEPARPLDCSEKWTQAENALNPSVPIEVNS